MITSPEERRRAVKNVRFHFDKLNQILEATHLDPEQANNTENETTEDDIEKNQSTNSNSVASAGDEPAPVNPVAKKEVVRNVPRQPVKAAKEFVTELPLPDFACPPLAGKFGARRRQPFVPDRFKHLIQQSAPNSKMRNNDGKN